MAFSYQEASKKVSDVKYLENYLALWITIKGVIDLPEGVKAEDLSEKELRELPRRYINSSDALKLMGVKIEKGKE